MSIAPRHDRHKKCFAYCDDNRCNCSRRRQSHRKGHPMTDMDDEAMKAMARRIAADALGVGAMKKFYLNGARDDTREVRIALAAIIERDMSDQDERLEYERRILSAECRSQAVINALVRRLEWGADVARTNPDAMDLKAAEILFNVAKMVRDIDVTKAPSPDLAFVPGSKWNDTRADIQTAIYQAAIRSGQHYGKDHPHA